MHIPNNSKRLESLKSISRGRCHSLKNRAGKWYVQCVDSDSGKFLRISTGHSEYDKAVKFLSKATQGRATEEQEQIFSGRLWKRIERARARAQKKGMEFSLSRDDVRALVERSGGFCEVSGARFGGLGPFQPSIDRIDPAKGYTPDNIRLVCLITNTAMLHYGEEAFAVIASAYCQKMGLHPKT